MENISIIGVDDEYPALEFIAHCCERIEKANLLGLFQNPLEAFHYLEKHPIDLIILDINLPYLNGIDFFQKLTHKPLCIFFSVETKHAIKAFELNVAHYLVKPVDFETFEKAFLKAYEILRIYKYADQLTDLNYMMIKSNYHIHKIYLKDVLWVEGYGEYIIIHTTLKKYMILERMHNFLHTYKHFGFVRIHKSFIVLQSHILSFNTSNVHLLTGHQLPIGRSFRQELKNLH